MTQIPRPRALAGISAGCIGLAALLAGCGDSEPEQPDQESPSNTIPQPEIEADDSVRLPLAMVSPEDQAQAVPLEAEGPVGDEESVEDEPAQEIEIARTAAFGCDDTVSVIRSVPMVTEDPVTAALQFLIDDQLFSHGSPAFSNPLAASEELSVASVEVDEGEETVRVALSGEPVTTGECESWQILTQIETTARVATGATFSEVTVDGEPLADLFGLPADREPLEIAEVTR